MVVRTCDPSTWKLRLEDCHDADLSYRLVRATGLPCLVKTKTEKEKEKSEERKKKKAFEC